MTKLSIKAVAVVFGLMIGGSASADCHPGYRNICWQERLDCLANLPPGTFPEFCEIKYKWCLFDGGCAPD